MLVVLLCLSGCYPLKPMYEQEDADRIAQKGTELMQAWLNENMPDTVLRQCIADSLMWKGDGNVYLTGYAYGSIEKNGETTDFAIDTVTGDVYFKMDADTKDALRRAAAAFLYDSMGLGEYYDASEVDRTNFDCSVMAPAHGSERFDSFDYGLPAGVKDPDAFVRDPASRPLLHINRALLSLPDDADISGYDLEAFEKLSGQCGMKLDGLTMVNSGQTVTFGNGNAGFYEYGILLEGDGYALRGAVRVKEEKRDASSKDMIVSDQRFDPELDLLFEETEQGFRFSFPNEGWGQGFRFCAEADSQHIHHDYIYSYGKYESLLSWKEQQDGSYVMISKNQTVCEFHLDGKLERVE